MFITALVVLFIYIYISDNFFNMKSVHSHILIVKQTHLQTIQYELIQLRKH